MSAFPPQVEADLMAYTVWVEKLDICENTKVLLRLILTSILEDVSYTRKDGQYLRWDERADKLQSRNQQRIAQGKQPVKGIHKGDLPTVKTMLQKALAKILLDVGRLQHQTLPLSRQELIAGNTLTVLPALEANRFSAVITSPPYANRYDYTRTYALELAYLGVDEEIFRLRQRLLSCTVENRPKLDWLQEYYTEIGQSERYLQISRMASSNAALQEINAALQIRNMRGEINNAGVLTMIDQYFTELAFIFAELYRVCRSGAYVAFVNDNVRYAGEVIPVDLLSTDLATSLGFEPVKIYVLPQRKGNSSQQMGKFGRVALRKSITVWRKP
jgi:site-specific DNA-methyltransferase (cytosine-N4-specific)